MNNEDNTGMVRHICEVFDDGRVDCLNVILPLSVLPDDALELLKYWCVEDFDFAFIDWKKREFVMHYETEHFRKNDC